MENDLVLALDCDGVIVNSLPLMDKCIADINYVASDEFASKVIREHRMREAFLLDNYFKNDLDLYNKYSKQEQEIFERLLKVNRITKDEVLEEVHPMYKNRIDYFTIYRIENVFRGVFGIIRYLYEKKKFKKIYIVTQFNSVLEVLAKYSLFKKYLSDENGNPMVEVVFIPFHDKENTPYIYDKERYFENGDRKRTNKAEYFAMATGENPKKTIYIDDSIGICEEAEILGAKAFYRDKECQDPLRVFGALSDYLLGKTDEDMWKEFMKGDEKVLKMIDF